MSIKGRMFTGKLESLVNTIREKYIFATLSKTGSGRVALDVTQKKYAQVSVGNVVEATSTDNILKLTGHGMKEGFLIRLTSTANSIIEEEIFVDEVLDANRVQLSAFLSATLAAGDTFEIYKPISERVASDGSSLATIVAPPIQIIKNGSPENVADDTNPALIVPIPVKIVDASGQTITINAGDIEINLNDMGMNFDRTRIGDGTNQLGINASSEALVHDQDVLDELTDLNAVDFATEAKQDDIISELVDIKAIDFATETTLAALAAIDFSTEAKQDTQITAAGATNTKLDSLIAKDYATSAKQDTQITAVGSTNTKLDSVITALGLLATQVTLAALNVLVGSVTETAPASDTASSGLNGRMQRVSQRLSALIALLPAAIGQATKAGSLSVTIASDQVVSTTPAAGATGSVAKGTLGAAGTATITAPANALGCFIKNQGSSDGDLYWEIGGTATAASNDLSPGQGTAFIPCGANITLLADASGCKYCVQWIIK